MINGVVQAPRPAWPLLVAGALAVTALLRVLRLDVGVLSPLEAPRALAAWQLSQGRPPDWWEAPGLALTTAGSFVLFGDSEASARLAPALAGVGTVAALLLYRAWLGWGPLAVACTLLALSPSGLSVSRSVAEDSLAGLTTLVVGWALISSWDRLQGGAPILIAAGMALLLQLGYAGVTGAIALILFAVAWSALRPGSARVSSPAWLRDAPGRFFVFASVFVLVGTGCLFFLNGFGLPSVGAWARQLDGSGMEARSIWSWLAMAGYEPVALLAGVPAALIAVWRWLGGITHSKHETPNTKLITEPAPAARAFLAIWGIFGLLLSFLDGQGERSTVFMAALPLTVLAGYLLGRCLALIDRAAVREFARGFPVVAACLVFGGLNLLKWAADPAVSSAPLWLAAAALVVGLLAAVVLSVAGPRPLPVLTLFALSWALAAQVHGVSRLSTPWLGTPDTPALGAVRLRQETGMLPYSASGQGLTVAVQEDLRAPFAWELRRVRSLAFLPELRTGPALMVGDTATVLAGYERWELPVSSVWSPAGWQAHDVVRWAATGDVPEASMIRRRTGLFIATALPLPLGGASQGAPISPVGGG